LLGGIVNAPIYVFTEKNGTEFPLGVFKKERHNATFANQRLQFLESMKKDGFPHLPTIIKNVNNQYLTTIDGATYSCFEYLFPDPSPQKKPISFSVTLQILGQFHAAAQKLPDAEALYWSNRYIKRAHYFSDEVLKELKSNLLDTPVWKQITRLSQFFATDEFVNIYNSLPRQIIHGDVHSNNILLSNKIPYFIDFDEMHYGVRLWDFASCILFDFLEEFLIMYQNGTLLSFIESNYEISGIRLNELEKKHLLEIVLFKQIETMAWEIETLKSAFMNHQSERFAQFEKHLTKSVSRLEKLLVLITH
jgi:Ser/Thr protein kinase RdoA (MazF antagonist)